MIEEWKPIEGFESIYHISNYGNLKSFKKDKNGYILVQTNSKGGYFSVILTDNSCNKKKCTRIHRLVAEAFIDNPDNKNEVNHIDSNRQNNNINNLEWVTRAENMIHARNNNDLTKEVIIYNKFIRPKTVIQKSLDGEFINAFINCKEASKSTGVCHRNILQVARGEEYKPGMTRKQAGGYIWSFKE